MELTAKEILANIGGINTKKRKLKESKTQYETMNGTISSVITILATAQSDINRASAALNTYYQSNVAAKKVEELNDEYTNVDNIINQLNSAIEISNSKIKAIETQIESYDDQISRLLRAYYNLSS